MKRLEAITYINSVYGLIELRGYIADEPNGNSENQPVLVIEEEMGSDHAERLLIKDLC